MYTKIITKEQFTNLSVDDVLWKFPSTRIPENSFDQSRKSDIDTYKVKSINTRIGITELIMTGDSLKLYSAAGNIGHIFLNSEDMINEKIWWKLAC